MTQWDAIIVAGGRGARLGGVSKPDLSVGGMSLLDRTLAAVAPARETVVVGGPTRAGVTWTVEDPPGSGPAKALAAGLAALNEHAAWTVVLAVDTPRAADAVPRLLATLADAGVKSDAGVRGDAGVKGDAVPADRGAAGGGGVRARVDGAWFVDEEGEVQPLLAIYRTAALLDGTRDLEEGTSMRRLVAGLMMVAVPDVDGVARDLDTWGDAEFWKERLG